MKPCVIKEKEHKIEFGNLECENNNNIRTINDPYFWLRDDSRTNPDILDILNRENKYTECNTKNLSELNELLYNEIKGHIKETDMTVPAPYKTHLYYTRTEEGKGYKIHCRKHKNSNVEQVILDENEFSNYNYSDVKDVEIFDDLLAYSHDITGNEVYDIYIINIDTGVNKSADSEV